MVARQHAPACVYVGVGVRMGSLNHWTDTYVQLRVYIEPRHDISNNTRSLIRAFASGLTILWLLSYWPNTIWSF